MNFQEKIITSFSSIITLPRRLILVTACLPSVHLQCPTLLVFSFSSSWRLLRWSRGEGKIHAKGTSIRTSSINYLIPTIAKSFGCVAVVQEAITSPVLQELLLIRIQKWDLAPDHLQSLSKPVTRTKVFDSKNIVEKLNSGFSLGKWQSWTTWSECSSTCGQGFKIRSRACLGERHHCQGKATQYETCPDNPECQVFREY